MTFYALISALNAGLAVLAAGGGYPAAAGLSTAVAVFFGLAVVEEAAKLVAKARAA